MRTTLRWTANGLRLVWRRHRVAIVAISVVLLFLSGMTDHLFARSLDNFSWPGGDGLVDKVARMESGKIFVKGLHNVWNRNVNAIPDCDALKSVGEKGRRVLVVIKTAVRNFENREAIRETWASSATYGRYAFRFVFVLGEPESNDDNAVVEGLGEEMEGHGDLLQSQDFVDVYRTNTRKFGLSLWLAVASPLAHTCPPHFTLLIDDDYMLSIPRLAQLLDERSEKEPLYEGYRIHSSPFRFRLHKHAVPLSAYPFSAYPPYVTAGAVLMSATTTRKFYYASLFVEEYNFDDIYAAILAKLMSVRPRHNEKFAFWTGGWLGEEEFGEKIAAHGYDPHRMRRVYGELKGKGDS